MHEKSSVGRGKVRQVETEERERAFRNKVVPSPKDQRTLLLALVTAPDPALEWC